MTAQPVTISDLPEDLLAHVLRFATGAVRRDGQPGSAVELLDWRYAHVSSAFRRAFLKNLSSLALTTPVARRLAATDWSPLRTCTSLRRIDIGSEADLSDAQLIRLFQMLRTRGVNLRQADFTLDRRVTHASALLFASLFGRNVTHFALRIPWNRRVRRRRNTDAGTPENPFNVQQDLPPIHDFGHPAENAEQDLHYAIDGPPLLPHMMWHQQNQQNEVEVPFEPNNNNGANPAPAPAGHVPLADLLDPPGEAMWNPGLPFAGQHAPNVNGSHPNPQANGGVPPVPPHQPHMGGGAVDYENFAAAEGGNGAGALNPAGLHSSNDNNSGEPQIARINALSHPMTDDVLASILSKMPALREFYMDQACLIMNPGIMPLASCLHLETLVLAGNQGIDNQAFKKMLAYLPRLRELRLRDLPRIGDPTISAVCVGPARKTLQVLELVKIPKVTDPVIRQLVNSCENLESVHIEDCPRITCEAASHLSCALHLKDIFFKPQANFPLTNRTSVHFSCAASTLRSLQLVGCTNLSLDGIVALGNLPGLRRLHLRGMGHVSQDIMRQLGTFPKLDDLLLVGPMHLTDLGVKVLIGQRGHRFLHLALVDTTRNLTDEALDCIMTWCISLRSLEVHGQFQRGAIDRLHDYMPNTSLTVVSAHDRRQHIEGYGGVWDPLVPELQSEEVIG